MTPAPDTRAGTLIAGRYRLRALLGAGGMGQVWRADDERLGREVAVKLIGAEAARGGQALERFRREARVTARLAGHPNIVTVYDFSEEPLYVVMEVVEGVSPTASPSTARSARAPLPPEPPVTPLRDVIDWTRQICAALGTAHAAGIVHRDLKPSNVLLTPTGTVKLLDFGIAGLLLGAGHERPAESYTRLTESGAFLGSPPYASPEQIQGRPVDHRTDLYSLGCLLHELAAGTPPFGTGPLHPLLLRHLEDPPPPLRSLRPELPAAFERLVLDLLAKDPSQRPADADAVAARLRDAGRPVAAYIPTVPAASAPDLRLARVFDLRAPDGRPAFAPAHPRVAPGGDRTALLTALRRAPVAVHLLTPEPDLVDPTRGRTVPASFRTDGTWIWSDQIAYYLDHYGYAPDPDLSRHLTASAAPVPHPPARVLSAAGRLVRTEPPGSLTGRP